MAVDEPMNLAQCPRCRIPVHRWKVGGIEYTADLTALDGPGATAAVLGGRKLYRITLVGGTRNIRPAYTTELAALSGAEPPTIVGGHPCKALTRPLTAPQQSGGATPRGKAPGPAAGRTAPSPDRSRRGSGVPTADRSRSEARTGPRCNRCSRPMADGTYAAIELGDLLVWAEHLTDCTA